MNNLFNGVATALITPMNKDLSIDYESYENIVKMQLNSNINGLIVSGTTGEGSTLTSEEKINLLKRTIKLRKDKNFSIILGTGSNNTKSTIEQTKLAKENGADAALIVTPYYNKTSQRGLISHYFAVADSVDIPIILYNVPGRTGMTIEPETVGKLAEHKNIVALKDATGDMNYMINVRNNIKNKGEFKLYSGEDATFFDFLVHGGDGVISVLSNCLPKSFIHLYELYKNNKINESRDLQEKLNPFISALFSDISPTPVKAILNYQGIIDEVFRLPIIPTTDEIKNNVINEYNRLKNLEESL